MITVTVRALSGASPVQDGTPQVFEYFETARRVCEDMKTSKALRKDLTIANLLVRSVQ